MDSTTGGGWAVMQLDSSILTRNKTTNTGIKKAL
jgi:hypothetical protein